MRASEFKPKILVVFDIDDTLVHTQTEVHVVKDGKVVNSLNSHDFTHYKLGPGESFDFENFKNAREFFDNHKPIIPMMNQLKRDIARGNKVVMVTARSDFDDKELFLDTFRKYNVEIDKVHVYRAGNLKSGSTEERKRQIIKTLLDKDNYSKAIMYDDAKPNLDLFVSLKKEHPSTKFYAWHVDLEGNASEYMREDVSYSNRPGDMQSRPYAIDPQLMNILERAAEAVDVDVKIVSGGQDQHTTPGGQRRNSSSTRHDLGQAADVQLYKNNKRIRSDSNLAKQFIRQCGMHGAKEVGYGYMGNHSIHIGLSGVDNVNTQGHRSHSQSWGSDDANTQGLDALQKGISDRFGGGGYT